MVGFPRRRQVDRCLRPSWQFYFYRVTTWILLQKQTVDIANSAQFMRNMLKNLFPVSISNKLYCEFILFSIDWWYIEHRIFISIEATPWLDLAVALTFYA